MGLKNCAFQYATMHGDVIVDKSELTLSEAKNLWNENYLNCAKRIFHGTPCQMYLWINMNNPCDYMETLYQIDNDAESDGANIYIKTVVHFPKHL